MVVIAVILNLSIVIRELSRTVTREVRDIVATSGRRSALTKHDTIIELISFIFKGLVFVYNVLFWKSYCKYSITQPLASATPSFSPEMISLCCRSNCCWANTDEKRKGTGTDLSWFGRGGSWSSWQAFPSFICPSSFQSSSRVGHSIG